VDHVVPLKRGGADDPSNMQWQSIEAAKAKDQVGDRQLDIPSECPTLGHYLANSPKNGAFLRIRM